MNTKFLISPNIVFLVILGGAVVLSFIEFTWTGWRPANCMPDHCFCEAIRPGTVAQPVNTWSSFGFVLVGLLVIRQSREDIQRRQSNLLMRQRAYPALFGMALIIGSAFYHAPLTIFHQGRMGNSASRIYHLDTRSRQNTLLPCQLAAGSRALASAGRAGR